MAQTSTAIPLYDDCAAEVFAERVGETLNSGAICLMISIGHRTGLFDTTAGSPRAV